jgi:hypothetical protein
MPLIEQAEGTIMAQRGRPAFDALRRASQRGDIKVRDLAAAIVAKRRTRPRRSRRYPRRSWEL